LIIDIYCKKKLFLIYRTEAVAHKLEQNSSTNSISSTHYIAQKKEFLHNLVALSASTS